ncbi:MAG: hypothetical protein ACLU4J_11020 [Butyricimonas paravirosa]
MIRIKRKICWVFLYNTKPETQAIVYYTRDNLKRVYELIEEDLTKGLPLLKDETTRSRSIILQKRQPLLCSSFLSIQGGLG